MNNLHRVFEKNTSGSDYFIGDIHGKYSLLMNTLRQMNFDFKRDRLFCVGDLVDRGHENGAVVALLEQPWFFSAFGNHEELITAAVEHPNIAPLVRAHVKNGGQWGWLKDESAPLKVSPNQEAKSAVEKIRKHCAWMMSVPTKFGTIGVIHADAPRVWPGEECTMSYEEDQIWARSKPKRVILEGDMAEPYHVENIDAVVHGHQMSADILKNANRIWIDTANVTGEFTILRDEEVIEMTRKQMRRHKHLAHSQHQPGF